MAGQGGPADMACTLRRARRARLLDVTISAAVAIIVSTVVTLSMHHGGTP